jgi:hypothetical protein
MIPLDAPRIRVCAPIFFLGHFACEVEGFVYSLTERPQVDVITFDGGHDAELELSGRYGTPSEDAIREALIAESKTVFTQHRLEEAFRDWHEGRREAAREHAGELRRVG